MTTAIKQNASSYTETEKVDRIASITKVYNQFRPRPHDFAFLRVPREQRAELMKLLIDHGTVENAELWVPFFDSFAVYENDSRVGSKSSTGYPYLSSNKSYPLFLTGMRYYLDRSLACGTIDHNRMVLSRLITLLSRRTLQQYVQELNEVGAGMVGDPARLAEYVALWEEMQQDLRSLVIYRVQSIMGYAGALLEEHGYNAYTCGEVEDILRRTQAFIVSQEPEKPVKFQLYGRPVHFKMEWTRNNAGERAFNQVVRDFEEKCAPFIKEEVF